MSVGGGKAPAEPTKKRPNEDDGPTAPVSKKLKDSSSILNKLRLKLIDALADIEKSAKAVLAQESDMMKVVPVEEQRSADYLPLMTTLKIRFAALKLACDGTVDVAKVFASIDLVGDMEGQASEASLRGITVQNAMSLLARLLKERKLPWPIADFDKCQALRQLSLRVALVGEAANTLQDVKEAKAEFAAHTGRIEEFIKATKRAGDDVSARVNQKLKMTTLKIRLQKY